VIGASGDRPADPGNMRRRPPPLGLFQFTVGG
jgi:hypothetical protein